jgi:hypothetical protein
LNVRAAKFGENSTHFKVEHNNLILCKHIFRMLFWISLASVQYCFCLVCDVWDVYCNLDADVAVTVGTWHVRREWRFTEPSHTYRYARCQLFVEKWLVCNVSTGCLCMMLRQHRIFHGDLKENDFDFYVVIKSL